MPVSHKQNALENLIARFSNELLECNEEIKRRIASPVPLITELGMHLISAGGKRIRPLLLLASARLCGYEPSSQEKTPRDVALAACVEFIHTATLLHDDVVDNSMLRRGEETANAIFGNKAPILVGDFLFARAFQMMTDDSSIEVMSILAKASARIAQGEIEQMAIQNDLSSSVDDYLEMIYGKTAALFEGAAEVGAIVGNASLEVKEALRSFGGDLGMCFQLSDDALDYAGDTEELGKSIGDDLKEGKITLPILDSYKKGTDEEKSFWKRVIEEGDCRDEDLAEAGRLIKKYKAIETTLTTAEFYAKRAAGHLSVFKDSELKNTLIDLTEYAVFRKN